ncbi:MAG: helix-turn-helix transcriptional regulator [Candidatus Kapabacteria bacterium]|nr:helix-turn-helix transcriptional regulator [Candidatus Kapabacteria bacterium]
MKKLTNITDNPFAALGLANAEERALKVDLTLIVNRIIEKKGLRQAEVCAALSIPQPRVSALQNYKLDHFSVERLLEFLTLLGQNVEIRVSPAAARKQAICVARVD